MLRRVTAASALLVVVLAWGSVASAQGREGTPQFRLHTLNDRGDESYKAGKFAEAIAAYQEALAIDPFAYALHENIGDAEKAMKEFGSALDAYGKAVELLEAKASAGNASIRERIYQKAMRILDADKDLASILTPGKLMEYFDKRALGAKEKAPEPAMAAATDTAGKAATGAMATMPAPKALAPARHMAALPKLPGPPPLEKKPARREAAKALDPETMGMLKLAGEEKAASAWRLFGLADQKLLDKDFAGAEEIYRGLTEKFQDEPMFWERLGDARRLGGDFAGASTAYERATWFSDIASTRAKAKRIGVGKE
ncbi:MAG: tetratricopeptide repeat protein [Planctomycetes bacterium]|nr:tetratricopeptide repeat protein [Planctomycetota bacterium]